MQKKAVFFVMFSFDSGFCMHNEAMPSHTTHTDTPTPIKSHSLLHVQTHKKKKKKTPTQSPTHRISDKRAPSTSSIQPSYWMFGFQYDTSVCVSVCCLLFIPLFNVVWLCSWEAELISFLMVGYQCLSQMNYAFLPYVISSQPGNTGTIW